MNLVLRLFIMSVSLLVVIAVVYMLVRKRLNESNSILWLFIAFMVMFFGFFPSFLTKLSRMLGIDYPPALLFLASIILLMMIAFKSSLKLSEMDAKINELAMELSILKEKNRNLDEMLKETDKK